MKQGPNIHIGSPAWGPDFYDRKRIIEESDFYIERNQDEAKVYFHNKWLKDWWRIHHGTRK
jgi:hypothetical protein